METELTPTQLKKKYNIKQVGGGIYSEGFFDCLSSIDNGIINIDVLIKEKLDKKIDDFVKKCREHKQYIKDGYVVIECIDIDELEEIANGVKNENK